MQAGWTVVIGSGSRRTELVPSRARPVIVSTTRSSLDLDGSSSDLDGSSSDCGRTGRAAVRAAIDTH